MKIFLNVEIKFSFGFFSFAIIFMVSNFSSFRVYVISPIFCPFVIGAQIVFGMLIFSFIFDFWPFLRSAPAVFSYTHFKVGTRDLVTFIFVKNSSFSQKV